MMPKTGRRFRLVSTTAQKADHDQPKESGFKQARRAASAFLSNRGTHKTRKVADNLLLAFVDIGVGYDGVIHITFDGIDGTFLVDAATLTDLRGRQLAATAIDTVDVIDAVGTVSNVSTGVCGRLNATHTGAIDT